MFDPSGQGKDQTSARWTEAHFDLIIVDTSPLLSASEALTITQLGDVSLFIVRENFAPRSAVHVAWQELLLAQSPHQPIVALSFVEKNRSVTTTPTGFTGRLRTPGVNDYANGRTMRCHVPVTSDAVDSKQTGLHDPDGLAGGVFTRPAGIAQSSTSNPASRQARAAG